jgi:hypothetical protein
MVAGAKKINFGALRRSNVRGVQAYCSSCGHTKQLGPFECAQWTDDVRLSDIEPLLVCEVCGERNADVRPDFDWQALP